MDRVMRADRSIFGRLVFCFVICVLLCGIVSAELPELLSLTDNTSNDFTIRKASGQECSSTWRAAIHHSGPLDIRNFQGGSRTHCALALVAVETVSSDLFVRYSVLRR
jgi:hypothetical protein